MFHCYCHCCCSFRGCCGCQGLSSATEEIISPVSFIFSTTSILPVLTFISVFWWKLHFYSLILFLPSGICLLLVRTNRYNNNFLNILFLQSPTVDGFKNNLRLYVLTFGFCQRQNDRRWIAFRETIRFSLVLYCSSCRKIFHCNFTIAETMLPG